jgi:hypothetical protein
MKKSLLFVQTFQLKGTSVGASVFGLGDYPILTAEVAEFSYSWSLAR